MSEREMISISGEKAERIVREHLERRLDEARKVIARLHAELEEKADACRKLGLDPEQILPDRDQLLAVLMPPFEDGDRVLLMTSATGDLEWPAGAHVRSGRILKNGQTEWSYLVGLDDPIGRDSAANQYSVLLTALEETPAHVREAALAAHDPARDTAAAASATGQTPAALALDED